MISLPATPNVALRWRARLEHLSNSTSHAPLPDLSAAVRDELGIDLSARYAGVSLPHPFGKASGQLSTGLRQIEDDCDAGIAFVVLKTVIAEDSDGVRAMGEWASDETRMRIERRVSRRGREGWSVTWKGRGWAGSLDEYLEFFSKALIAGRERHIPVIPSVKYHLPSANESFRSGEYEHTTWGLLGVWDRVGCGGEMILEKNLSPTLAGDERGRARETVLRWLRAVPGLVHSAAPGRVRLGIKLMNALFDEGFQVEMLRAVTEDVEHAPAFLVVFNRLFDPKAGVAFGGWDLSDRNLRVLDLARAELRWLPPLSATGNICSGRVMVEYALRGCENGQVHTFFQLPLSQYSAAGGSRSARALHTLLLHPTEGLSVWLRHLHEAGELDARGGVVRFLDLVEGKRQGQ